MKKICISFVILILMFTNICFADENNKEYDMFFRKNSNKISDQATSDFEEWIKKYQNEDVPENERIYSYRVGSQGYSSEIGDDGCFRANVAFYVETPSSESIWKNRNICFLRYAIVGDNMELKYIDRVPKNYDKFLERFEEYKANKEESEITTTSGEKNNYLSQTEEVIKLSNGIKIVCVVILMIAILSIFINIKKFKRKI